MWAVGLLVLSPTPAGAQALDSAQVVQVLEEAVAAYSESSDSLRANDRFRDYLAELIQAWDVAPDADFPPRPPEPEQVIDSLVARDEIRSALVFASETRSYGAWNPMVRRVFDNLAEVGRIDHALALADSTGRIDEGIAAVLESAPESIGWRWRLERTARFIRELPGDEEGRTGRWGVLNYYRAEHDFDAAWSRAGEWEPDSVLAWRIDILDLAFDQELPTADSLFVDTYLRARDVAETETRNQLVADLHELCDWKDVAACADLEFPPDPRLHRTSLQRDLERAVGRREFSEADELAGRLGEQVSPLDLALIVSRGLSRADHACIYLTDCSRAYDSLLAVRLPELDRIAAANAGPSADSLNAHLAGLWAGRNLQRAWTAVERIESPEARIRGLQALGLSAYRWNRPAALEALSMAGSAGAVRLEPDFLYFMSWGKTARANEVIALMNDTWSRTRARLAWAELVLRNGRWEEARRLAIAALDEWDPSAEPLVGSRGQFNLFARMDTYADVIAWARARPDRDDRAAALAAAIGTRPRPQDPWARPRQN